MVQEHRTITGHVWQIAGCRFVGAHLRVRPLPPIRNKTWNTDIEKNNNLEYSRAIFKSLNLKSLNLSLPQYLIFKFLNLKFLNLLILLLCSLVSFGQQRESKQYFMMNITDKQELPVEKGRIYASSDEKTAVINENWVLAVGNGDCIIYAVADGKQTEFAHITVGWQVQNPVLPYSWDIYADDSEVRNFNGTLYTYSCFDGSPNGYASPYYLSLSTPDIKRWDCKFILSSYEEQMPYRGKILWDCDGCYYNGKYLLYGFYDPDMIAGDNFMFVLESDEPRGPFRNFRWITGDKSGKKIDGMSAQIFIDDDGSRYILYARQTPETNNYNHPVIARLTADNVITESSITDLRPYMKDFFENPSLRKRGDTYYFLYAENCGAVTTKNWTPKRLSYATSKSPLGDYTYRGVIITVEHLEGNTNIQGCIEPHQNHWYLFYHRVLNGLPFRRTLCVENITFDNNGLISPVEPTSSGISEGLNTANPVWFNTAVFGKNYKHTTKGRYGSVLVNGSAEIGFRYLSFTGKEKRMVLHGAGLENISSIKIITDGKTIGERQGNGEIILTNVPKGKTELTVVISSTGETLLETFDIFVKH
jgi:hypothetical protein